MKLVSDIFYVPMCGPDSLVDTCGINYRTIEKGYTANSPIWQSIKDPADNRRRLIRYDTMKPTYRALVRAVLLDGMDPEQWHQVQLGKAVATSQYTLTERLEQVLTNGYRRYEGLYASDDISRAGRKTTLCLARAAGVVALLAEVTRNEDVRSYAAYSEVIAWLNEGPPGRTNYDYYFPKGNRYLPLNPVMMKEKILQLTVGPKASKKPRSTNPLPIEQVIHLPRKGNKNRDEFQSDAELNAWVAIAFMHGRKDPKAYVTRKIREVCRIVGREVPSASWFSNLLASPKLNALVAPHRHGTDSALASRYTHSITMARAMYAGDCWMMDATRVNFIEHATTEDPKKKRFLVVIAIRDAYSGEIVGCHFDTKEDRWGYTNALKMAVKLTGYLPHTLVYDRFPGHFSDEMAQLLGAIERRGTRLVCTHKATGKALLERWWDTLQTVFLSRSKYYYGQGIRSTREYAHRSPQYLLKLRKEAHRDGFDFDQAWQEAWRCIEEFRQTPLSYYSKVHKNLDLSPTQLHEQSEKPNVIGLSTLDQAGLFWLTKVLEVKNGVSHEVHGHKYNYAIYDNELLYRYQRVAVRYEEADPSSVMLFAVGPNDEPTDFFIKEVRLTTDVVIYGSEADPAQLAKRQALGKQVLDERKAELDEILRGTDQDPEYLLNMGRYVSKEEFESAQSAILYDQMSTVDPTPATVVRAKKKAPLSAPPPQAATKASILNLITY